MGMWWPLVLINERDSTTVPATVNRAAFYTTDFNDLYFNKYRTRLGREMPRRCKSGYESLI